MFTVNDFAKIDFAEIYRLRFLLENTNIPFEFNCVPVNGGYQLHYPNKDNYTCSVILHQYSYGNSSGLLEIMGLLTDEELEHDYVRGGLTAQEVFERIQTDWTKINKGVI